MPEAAKPDPKATKRRQTKPEVFHLHSLVRDVSTKLQRAQAPGRQRFKQMLGGGIVRLVRGRPVAVSKALLMKLLPELRQKELEGILKVTLPNGQRVDLGTLKVAEPAAPVPPAPKPPMDSAARDQTFDSGVGVPIPQNLGGIPEGVELPVPEAARGMPEGEPEDVVEVEAVADLSVVPEAAAKALYDSKSKADLQALLQENGLDASGNKMDLAKRLVAAGYKE